MRFFIANLEQAIKESDEEKARMEEGARIMREKLEKYPDVCQRDGPEEDADHQPQERV